MKKLIKLNQKNSIMKKNKFILVNPMEKRLVILKLEDRLFIIVGKIKIIMVQGNLFNFLYYLL